MSISELGGYFGNTSSLNSLPVTGLLDEAGIDTCAIPHPEVRLRVNEAKQMAAIKLWRSYSHLWNGDLRHFTQTTGQKFLPPFRPNCPSAYLFDDEASAHMLRMSGKVTDQFSAIEIKRLFAPNTGSTVVTRYLYETNTGITTAAQYLVSCDRQPVTILQRQVSAHIRPEHIDEGTDIFERVLQSHLQAYPGQYFLS